MHSTAFPGHLPPSAVAAAECPVDPPAPPRARDLCLALLGLLALGAAAALGGSGAGPGLRLIPSVILVELPALALTAPALIAVHQFLRLEAAPEALAAALGRALIHAGRVAAGLAVVVLFFAATTGLAAPMLACSLAAVGVFTSATAWVELAAAERRAARRVAPAFALLLVGWLALSWLVALRIGVDVAGWALGLGGLGA